MSEKTFFPENYKPRLDLIQTQRAIKIIKDNFERYLAVALNLRRVSAPMFVPKNSGLNDDLNGVERAVEFDMLDGGSLVQVVHSLAKWKRMALGRYGFKPGEGLYTDMNAIRRDETLDNLHSIYVDQWDWEKVITYDQRNKEYLKETVRSIYEAIKETARTACYEYPAIDFTLTPDITFITTQELEDRWPDLTPKERENAVCKEYGSVFLMKIGDVLKSGKKHDGRAPDYDDWSLNGDILVWNDLLECSFELSSMGIRVDEKTLLSQLEKAGCPERASLPFHQALLNGQLPYTIGGGLGQSRLCMLMLRKAHIGEVHASVWPDEMIKACGEHNIPLL